MALSIDDAIGLARAPLSPLRRSCLWPAPYDQDTFESAWAFVRAQHTWNEAETAEQPMPTEPYLEEYAWEWQQGYTHGYMLAEEKCRRMVISWEARALELHKLGLGRQDQLLIGEDLEAAAKHVWRLEFLYQGLQKRNPGWKLPDNGHLLYKGDRRLSQFSLPNGSVCSYGNGEASSIQGDGYRVITMEEAGLYRYLSHMVAQAKIVSQARAGVTGGFVNLITNTPPLDSPGAYQWKQIKCEAK